MAKRTISTVIDTYYKNAPNLVEMSKIVELESCRELTNDELKLKLKRLEKSVRRLLKSLNKNKTTMKQYLYIEEVSIVLGDASLVDVLVSKIL
jgi:transcription initiation factor IIE alpha subunit